MTQVNFTYNEAYDLEEEREAFFLSKSLSQRVVQYGNTYYGYNDIVENGDTLYAEEEIEKMVYRKLMYEKYRENENTIRLAIYELSFDENKILAFFDVSTGAFRVVRDYIYEGKLSHYAKKRVEKAVGELINLQRFESRYPIERALYIIDNYLSES